MASVPARRLIVGAISSLAIALTCTGSAAAFVNPVFTEQPATAEAVSCSPIIVYASRGANENPAQRSQRAPGQFEADGVTPRSKYYEGLGEELLPIYTEFRDNYAPGTVSLVTNRAPQSTKLLGAADPNGPADVGYRGVGVTFSLSAFYDYALSVNEGKRAAIRDLDTIHARCPDSKLAVIGYSAGAEISRRALASLSWTPEPGKGMALLFGDPTWKPRERNLKYVGDVDGTQFGSIRAARDGDFGFKISVFGLPISSIPSFPAGWNGTTYCHGGDLSCQYRGGTIMAHETYHLEDAVGASSRLASYLGGPFVRPVVTARLGVTAACYRRSATLGAAFKVEGATAADAFTFKGTWEPTDFTAFAPIRLTGERNEARRSFISGLFPRLVLSVGGHKLDYRNAC